MAYNGSRELKHSRRRREQCSLARWSRVAVFILGAVRLVLLALLL